MNIVEETLNRAWDQLVGRLAGPRSFRVGLQPMAAAVLAIAATLDIVSPRIVAAGRES